MLTRIYTRAVKMLTGGVVYWRLWQWFYECVLDERIDWAEVIHE